MELLSTPAVTCAPCKTCPTGWNFFAMSFNVLLPAAMFALRFMRKEHRDGLLSESWQKDVKDLLAIHLRLRRSDQMSQDFWQEYMIIRQRFGEMAMPLILGLHALVTVLYCSQALGWGVSHVSRFWFTAWSVMGCLIIICVEFPCLHNWRGLPVSYILASLSLCSFILPIDGMPKQQVMISNAPLLLGYVMMAPLGGVIGSILAISVYSGVAMISFAHASGATDYDIWFVNWWQMVFAFNTALLASVCSILYVSIMVLLGMRRKAELAEHEAVSSLLSLVCDAVVEVDTDGAITSESDHLYSILLMRATANAKTSFSQGTQLQSFLFSDADRQIFADLIEQASATKNAEVRHMGMRDAMGSLVKVEVFLLSFCKGSSSRFLVGIREHSDYERTRSVEVQDSKDSRGWESRAGISEHPDYEQRVQGQDGKERASLTRIGGHPDSAEWTLHDIGKRAPDLETAPGLSAQGGWGELLPAQALGSKASSEFSGDSVLSARSRVEERFLEGMMPTKPRAVEVSLINVMLNWRLASSGLRSCCCAFHAYTKELKYACRRLQKRPCIRNFNARSGTQCPDCGIDDSMDPDSGECIICEMVNQLYPPLLEEVPSTWARRQPRPGGNPREPPGGGQSGNDLRRLQDHLQILQSEINQSKRLEL